MRYTIIETRIAYVDADSYEELQRIMRTAEYDNLMETENTVIQDQDGQTVDVDW